MADEDCIFPDSALLIKSRWIAAILSGEKVWELRGCRTARRGCIGLIECGSGLIVGTCDLIDVVGPLTPEDLRTNHRLHRVPSSMLGAQITYRRIFAWVVANARRVSPAVQYEHPQGAVIWVRLCGRLAKR